MFIEERSPGRACLNWIFYRWAIYVENCQEIYTSFSSTTALNISVLRFRQLVPKCESAFCFELESRDNIFSNVFNVLTLVVYSLCWLFVLCITYFLHSLMRRRFIKCHSLRAVRSMSTTAPTTILSS